MLRILKIVFLALVGICLLTIAIANRGPVTVKLMPDEFAAFLPGMTSQVTMPLFILVLGAVLLGIVVGFVWEWLRETRHRSEASRKGKEVRQLKREMRNLKGPSEKTGDDVLAQLDMCEEFGNGTLRITEQW